jgi:hypothetical protein
MPHTPLVQYAIDLQLLLKNCRGINKFRDRVIYFLEDDVTVGVTYSELRECMESETIPNELTQYIK